MQDKWREVERNLFQRDVSFAPQLHPGPLSHINTLVHSCGRLYHMWMKGNYFSREIWPWCRTRIEKESHRIKWAGTLLFTSLNHPFHPMISKLPCALRPLPGERFPSRPQMKKAGMLSCLSPPASCWMGRGRVGVFGEVRTVPSGHALQSSLIQTQGFKSYFPLALRNVEALLAGNETLLCIRGPASLRPSLRLALR